jgi:hypothetical protein
MIKLLEIYNKKSVLICFCKIKQTVNTPTVADKLVNIRKTHAPAKVRYFEQ